MAKGRVFVLKKPAVRDSRKYNCKHEVSKYRCKHIDCRDGATAICKPHGNYKATCKLPGCLENATARCPHGKFKIICKDPECAKNATALCPCNNYKATCKNESCIATAYDLCKHERRRRMCTDPDCIKNATGICDHGKHVYRCTHPKCIENANGLCKPHGQIKSRCTQKPCVDVAAGICDHGRRKETCTDPKCIEAATLICEHKKRKSRCTHIDCREGASEVCVHGKVKFICGHKDCIENAKGRCASHGKLKEFCNDPECGGGSKLCATESCDKKASKKFHGYCMTCYMSFFPNETIFRNYKTKEYAVLFYVKEAFPDLRIVHDKRVDGGSSNKRPDFLIDQGSHVVIVEVDEESHCGYDQSCEEIRMKEIWEDIGNRPVVFIRFNPDGNSTGPSCWGVDENGLAVVKKKRAAEWQARLSSLKKAMEFWLTTVPTTTIETIKLFY